MMITMKLTKRVLVEVKHKQIDHDDNVDEDGDEDGNTNDDVSFVVDNSMICFRRQWGSFDDKEGCF